MIVRSYIVLVSNVTLRRCDREKCNHDPPSLVQPFYLNPFGILFPTLNTCQTTGYMLLTSIPWQRLKKKQIGNEKDTVRIDMASRFLLQGIYAMRTTKQEQVNETSLMSMTNLQEKWQDHAHDGRD